MDDMVILAVGRQFIELSIQREQLYRQVLALQAEVEALKASAKAEVAKQAVTGPKLVPKNED